ncbi:sulfurtransferase [Cellulosimicrobium cellulans]|uniref:sulfurtransferase n=1 Tax=Cellulosimicrobium cellulans TaxID=1710 RepID=UPI00365F010C
MTAPAPRGPGHGTDDRGPDAARRDHVLVTVPVLAAALAGERPPVVLDVRWALGVTDGREQHRAGHVPGAVYVDLETELAAPPSPAAGRHPLPEPADLQAAARRWGVRADRPVVVYDAVGGTSAARAWWLLRWAGHDDVRILDGGLAAWQAAGHALDEGDVRPEPGDVVVTPGGMPVLDADGAADLATSGVLLDARAAERYRGEVEPVDPRAGHVPGAVSAPTTDNLAADGAFLADDALRERFAGLGVVGVTAETAADDRPAVGVYCGSGVTAAHEVAALATLGVEAALYAGSWSQWSNDPARPAAT